MRNWMKQFGIGVSLLFTLGVSSTAMAYPPQCMDVCSCASSCAQPCYYGTKRFTCADEICECAGKVSSPQASSTQKQQEQQESQEQQDASQNVCTDQAKQSAPSEN